MTPLDKMRHLLAMAAADQRMNEAELGFLSDRAVRLGLTELEFYDALDEAVSGRVALSIPKSTAERRVLLKELVRMMAADGQLAPKEKELFAKIAVTMDLSNDDLHQVIDATIAEDS